MMPLMGDCSNTLISFCCNVRCLINHINQYLRWRPRRWRTSPTTTTQRIGLALILNKLVHHNNKAWVIEPNNPLITPLLTILTLGLVLYIGKHIMLALITQMRITQQIRITHILELHIQLIYPWYREYSTHDNLIKVILPNHIWMVKQHLLHSIKRYLRNSLLLLFRLEDILRQLNDLECDLV